MKKREPFPDDVLERETRAIQAIDAAHKLPSGPARIELLRRRQNFVPVTRDLRRPEQAESVWPTNGSTGRYGFPVAYLCVAAVIHAARFCTHACLCGWLRAANTKPRQTTAPRAGRCSSCGAEDLSGNAETEMGLQKGPPVVRRRGGPIWVRGS